MKRILLLVMACGFVLTGLAQTVTLTFSGRDAQNHYVQLNQVTVTNVTRGWQETLVWPDTILTMQNGTGIDDAVETCHGASLQLSQNNPNPFNGTTHVNLTVADAGMVMMEIADVNGKIVGTHRVCPQQGTHQFRITLSHAGTYILTARQNGKSSSVKMVCHGGGNGNRIEYIGSHVETLRATSLRPKGATTNPFQFGDQMEYVGTATIGGNVCEARPSASRSRAPRASSCSLMLRCPLRWTDSLVPARPRSPTSMAISTTPGRWAASAG